MSEPNTPSAGWTEVTWRVPTAEAEALSDALGAATEGSVLVTEDGAHTVLVAAVEAARDTPGWREELRVSLDSPPAEALVFRPLADHDWKNAWRDVWHAFRIGPFAIVPRDHASPLRGTDVRLILEPGVAFGTGRHATTRACLRALSELQLDGARVLDAGFGTGILGVAAALRGALVVEGFDVDRHALPVAEELASDNGVAERCRFLVGGFERLADCGALFELVLANIYADVVEEHASELAARLAPGGTLIVSGCAREHRARIERALAANAIELESVIGRRWLTFVGRAPGSV